MSAVISVLASDAPSASASLYGTFDASNRAFLERHLDSLAGDVVIDCSKVAALDDAARGVLDRFIEDAARAHRRVVIRGGDRLPARAH
jgi:anti-anti-sigma regulatory factor